MQRAARCRVPSPYYSARTDQGAVAFPACRRIDVEGVGPTNHAGLTSGVTQQDLDGTWRKELLRLYGVMQSYKQVAPDPPPGADPCEGKTDAECAAHFRPWADRSYGQPKEWIQGSERDITHE